MLESPEARFRGVKPGTIAIDGPAGSGKSTLGAALARKLGYVILDIGVVYRLVTLTTLRMGGQPDALESVALAASHVLRGLEVRYAGGETAILLDGALVNVRLLQTNAVTDAVPFVAMHEAVRERIREVQRSVAAGGRAILAGRDIGTVVLPDADLKLYLDVSLEERAARRRWSLSPNDPMGQAAIAELLAARDVLDAKRNYSPLRVPPDAVVFRTDRLTVDETVSLIIAMCGLEHDRAESTL
jgi:cytidylate kinase